MASRDIVTQSSSGDMLARTKYYLGTKNIRVCCDRSIVMKRVNSLVNSNLRQWLNSHSILAVSCYIKTTQVHTQASN